MGLWKHSEWENLGDECMFFRNLGSMHLIWVFSQGSMGSLALQNGSDLCSSDSSGVDVAPRTVM